MDAIRHPKAFWAGVLFIALGGGVCIIAIDYTMGSAARIGPGYFPRTLGLLLALLGASLVLRSFRSQGETGTRGVGAHGAARQPDARPFGRGLATPSGEKREHSATSGQSKPRVDVSSARDERESPIPSRS